jgi:trans-2,3-dihydro-3-hydroxyanthranilate isomerase
MPSIMRLPVELYDNGPHYVFVELESPEAVAALYPDMSRLAALGSTAFDLVIDQGAEIGRPSPLHARAIGSFERLEVVEVGGSAVVIARGEFSLPAAL